MLDLLEWDEEEGPTKETDRPDLHVISGLRKSQSSMPPVPKRASFMAPRMPVSVSLLQDDDFDSRDTAKSLHAVKAPLTDGPSPVQVQSARAQRPSERPLAKELVPTDHHEAVSELRRHALEAPASADAPDTTRDDDFGLPVPPRPSEPPHPLDDRPLASLLREAAGTDLGASAPHTIPSRPIPLIGGSSERAGDSLASLTLEVATLRRRLALATAAALIALALALVVGVAFAVHLLARGQAPATTLSQHPALAPQAAGLQPAAVLAPAVTNKAAGKLNEDPEPAPPELVRVAVDVRTPGTSIAMNRVGEPPEALAGPFPRALMLPPGRYTFTASKPGYPTFTRQIELSPDRPERQVTVELTR